MRRSLYASLIVLSLIWGGSFFFIKVLLPDYGPWTIAFFRGAFGLATIAVLMIALKQPFRLGFIPWLPMLGIALINTAFPWALIGFSETRIPSGMASVLNATTPLWTVVVGIAFFRAGSSRTQWIGLGIAFAGLLVLLGVNPVSIVAVDPLGFVCMMGATICYAFGAQLSKRLLQGLTMYQTTFGTLLCTVVCCGAAAFILEPVSLAPLASPASLGAMIGLGVFGSGIAYLLFYYLIQQGSAELATTVTYLVPVSAILWGFVLLDESVSLNLLAGAVLVLGGVYLSNRTAAGQRAKQNGRKPGAPQAEYRNKQIDR